MTYIYQHIFTLFQTKRRKSPNISIRFFMPFLLHYVMTFLHDSYIPCEMQSSIFKLVRITKLDNIRDRKDLYAQYYIAENSCRDPILMTKRKSMPPRISHYQRGKIHFHLSHTARKIRTKLYKTGFIQKARGEPFLSPSRSIRKVIPRRESDACLRIYNNERERESSLVKNPLLLALSRQPPRGAFLSFLT